MNILFQISLVFLSITIIGLILRYLKQPLILAYVVAGIILSPSVLNISFEPSLISTVQTVVVSSLLFIFGLKIKGKVISFLGTNLIINYLVYFVLFFSLLLVFFISVNLSIFESVLLSLCLSFSSTIVSLKLLDDKKDSENLYGKLATSFNYIQSFLILVAVIFLQNYSLQINNQSYFRESLEVLLKSIIILGNIYLISNFILPRFSKIFLTSQEFLVLFSVSWILTIVGSFKFIGLPYELGALFAGIFLANQEFGKILYNKLASIRDFFLLILFTILSLQIDFNLANQKVFLILILVLFVYILKNLIISFVLRLASYSRRVSLLSSISLSQVGEYSLLLLSIISVKIDAGFYSVFISLFILSVIISSYLIHYSEKVLNFFEPMVGFYIKDVYENNRSSHNVIVFGCGVDGYNFLNEFYKENISVLGVDFNPEVVSKLSKRKMNVIFGDAEDKELFEKYFINESKMVVSTISDFDTNKFILKELKAKHYKGVKIVYSYSSEEAIELYRLGANFVVLPNYLSSEIVSQNTMKFGFDIDKYESEKAKSLELINKKLLLGLYK